MCDIKLTLAAARMNAGYSQKAAAKALDIAPATLCAWERGKREVSELAMTAMASIYGVPRDALFVPETLAKSE